MNNKRYLLLVVLALWGLLAPAGLAAQPTPAVLSYTLVNADTDLDIGPLPDGAVLDLATLPTRNLNIRANTDPTTVGSVNFALSGAQAEASTENVVPYALFSDIGGDYFAWTPPLGSYTLTATPYAEPAGGGASGTALTIGFTVVNSVGYVVSYTLVNADTDLDIGPLPDGAVLDLARLPTRHLNIRANIAPATVGSVNFALSGAETATGIENVPPYALFSDLAGDYFAWTPTLGAYTLTATPFSAAGGGGVLGTGLTLGFVVLNSTPLPVVLTAFAAEAAGPGQVALRWATASELHSREFVVERSPDGQRYAAVGTVAGAGTSTAARTYRYTDATAPAGPAYYRLRQVDLDGTTTYSPVRTVAVASPAGAFAVFPTLATAGQVHYALGTPPTGTELLELLNLLGQPLGHYEVAPSGTGAVPLAGLAPGAYLLRLTSALGRFSQRFVVP